jgi:hypothetical protein
VVIVYLYGRPLGVFYRSPWAASPVFYSCSPPLDSAGNHKKKNETHETTKKLFRNAVHRNSSTLALHFWIQLKIIKKNETHENKKHFRRSLRTILTLALHLWIQLEIIKKNETHETN